MLSGLLLTLLLLVALLAIPVVLRFHISWPEQTQRELELQWAYGLVRVQLPPSPSGEASAEGKEVAEVIERAAHRPREKSTGKMVNFMAVIRQKPFRQRILRYLRDCWRAIHKQEMRLHFRIGLGDPADTGQLWAYIGPLAALLTNVKGASIELEPQFDEELFELESSGRIEFVPLQLIYLTLAMVLSPQVWRGLRELSA
jgi:hypothetical protein